MNITDFLNEELADYASYSTLRAISRTIDKQSSSGCSSCAN